MTNEERGGGNDRPTWPNKEAEEIKQGYTYGTMCLVRGSTP